MFVCMQTDGEPRPRICQSKSAAALGFHLRPAPEVDHDRAMADVNSPAAPPYRLDDQVGFVLRRVTQRHLAIFAAHIQSMTPTQFAALAKLAELGPTSQNALGRATAMDAATIKGVVDRLREKNLVSSAPEDPDRRRITLMLTEAGREAFATLSDTALRITEQTLEPLSAVERLQFLDILRRLA
jgi:MarR family transcriptional regulator, lower aerobic nicotinate degradation pathway regulator